MILNPEETTVAYRCPECGGPRLSEKARAPKMRGLTLAEVCQEHWGNFRTLGGHAEAEMPMRRQRNDR